MDIVEYLNEKDDLEIREKRLFEIIDKIDKESYKLFSEVTDLDLNSYYKVDNLYIRINHVTDMLEEVSNIYDSLACLEANTLISIRKKRSRKKLLVALISSLIVFINLYIGLINYLIFSSIVDNSHLKKLESMSKRVKALDKVDLFSLGITLGNASNLLKGKMNRLYAMANNKEISQDIIAANNYIACFLSKELPDIGIEDLSPNSKKIMIELLQKDLNSKSSDIHDLLNELKSKNDSEIKLIKEIN